MNAMHKRFAVLGVLAFCAAFTAAFLAVGCTSAVQESQPDTSAVEASTETGESITSTNDMTEMTGAPAAAASKKALLSLDEYAQLYPLQTAGWTKVREDDRSMGGMSQRWHAFCAEMGSDGIPVACGSCHMANYDEFVAEHGEQVIMETDATYDVEWMGCGTCHNEDLESGVHANTVYKDYFISDFGGNIPEEDAVCGQCHMIFPGTYVAMPEYQGTMDLYKYGTDADGVLKAYKEAFTENPAVPTEEMQALFFHVGMTYFDEAIGAYIYGWDNESALEMYQGSNHQALGLTCTDCHMPTVTADDGTTYTEHYACEPLESKESMEVCLTCHTNSGVSDLDGMKTFLAGKQAELADMQKKTHDDLDALYALLEDATANGGYDEDVLAAARDAYTDAYFYYVFERADDHGADDGAKAAHNFTGSMELLEKADALVVQALESMQ